MVVVLPLPLTPTTSTTCGLCAAVDRQRLRDRRPGRGDDLVGEDAADLLAA